jgi:hypothetical protein
MSSAESTQSQGSLHDAFAVSNNPISANEISENVSVGLLNIEPFAASHHEAPQVHVQNFMPLMGAMGAEGTPQPRNSGVTLSADYEESAAVHATPASPFLSFMPASSAKSPALDFVNFMNTPKSAKTLEATPFWEKPGPVASDVIERFSQRKEWLQSNLDQVFETIKSADVQVLNAKNAVQPTKPAFNPAFGAIHTQKPSNLWSMPLR